MVKPLNGRIRLLALLGASLLAAPAALAQTVPAPNPSPTASPGPGPIRNDTPESLTQQLNQSEGVIQPPRHIDPDMQKPAPAIGSQSTPVIPPPGTPENRPDMVPK